MNLDQSRISSRSPARTHPCFVGEGDRTGREADRRLCGILWTPWIGNSHSPQSGESGGPGNVWSWYLPCPESTNQAVDRNGENPPIRSSNRNRNLLGKVFFQPPSKRSTDPFIFCGVSFSAPQKGTHNKTRFFLLCFCLKQLANLNHAVRGRKGLALDVSFRNRQREVIAEALHRKILCFFSLTTPDIVVKVIH